MSLYSNLLRLLPNNTSNSKSGSHGDTLSWLWITDDDGGLPKAVAHFDCSHNKGCIMPLCSEKRRANVHWELMD